MATYEEIEHGSITLGEILTSVTIGTLSTLSRGLVAELVSPFINDFNKMNYDFMKVHMMRNAFEKAITLNNIGENAYSKGDPQIQATPAQYPSYTFGNNYMEFVNSVNNGEKMGYATTRVNVGNDIENKYFDADENDKQSQIEYSSDFKYLNKNSILFKTQRLLKLNKLKTIVSKFHTDSDITYNGQVRTNYGESHGRNLLTKEAEKASESNYPTNGYDNPYCRVWTHNHKYDKISKTMRADGDYLNYWEGFEWNDTDKGHGNKEENGELYDYAWRGKHNQDRRKNNSVLDPHTGLVKITPQYRLGGGEKNRHTKECMFSIENLAWKDYDPYSFEEALSWEQRGPLGGRIMWFPPYGLEVTETTNAKWNTNEFIGRGEPVYTYVNTERSGNLSFYMLTDHPSSIDYASWWDDNGNITGVDNGQGNSENDYLRYFAGCANDDNGLIEETQDDLNDSKTGGLIVKPTPMTDEYIKPDPVLVKKVEPKSPDPVVVNADTPSTDPTTIHVEFFVFFPNNYSGYWDGPKNTSNINAIAYLLAGRNTMKQNQKDVQELKPDSPGIHYDNLHYPGYEMQKGVTLTNKEDFPNEYIQGGNISTSTYTMDKKKKWWYRIDHEQPYKGGNSDPLNTINQGVFDLDLEDTKSYGLNMKVDGDEKEQKEVQNNATHRDELYSFAEVAAAFYSNNENLSLYLKERGVNTNKVNKLIELFNNENYKLSDILCEGTASSHGLIKDSKPTYKEKHYIEENGRLVSAVGKESTNQPTYFDRDRRNETLAKNRSNTIFLWVIFDGNNKWQRAYIDSDEVKNSWDETVKLVEVSKDNTGGVSGLSAKIGRSAHCILTFTSGIKQEEEENKNNTQPEEPVAEVKNDSKDLVGFRYLPGQDEKKPNGQTWRYYEKDETVKYFEQEAKNNDNYENVETENIVVKEQDVIDIFNGDYTKPKVYKTIKTDSKYRGEYNKHGFYISTFEYIKRDDKGKLIENTPTIKVIDYNYYTGFNPNDYLYDDGELYFVLDNLVVDARGKTKEQIWNDPGFRIKINNVSNLIVKYAEGDYIKHIINGNEIFYECLKNYDTEYSNYIFDANDWTEVTVNNISEAIVSPYIFVSDPRVIEVNNIIYDDEDGVFKLCKKHVKNESPNKDTNNWTKIVTTEFEEGTFKWHKGDYVTYEHGGFSTDLYVCIDDTPYSEEWRQKNWGPVYTTPFDYLIVFKKDQIVEYNGEYYKANKNVYPGEYTTDLSIAMPKLIKNSSNPTGNFDNEYQYKVGDYCLHENKYYKSDVDFSTKTVQDIPFETALEEGSWEQLSDDKLYTDEYDWDLRVLVEKSAAVLCYTVDEMFKTISGDSDIRLINNDITHSNIWKYGKTNNLVTPQTVHSGVDLYAYATTLEPGSKPDSGVSNPPIQFTQDEHNYLECIVKKEYPNDTPEILETRMKELRTEIILYRILDGINKIENDTGVRKVCENPAESEDEMKEKTKRNDDGTDDKCKDKRWVDRDDGFLVRVCDLDENGDYKPTPRFDPNKGEGDWNKLRYDQEYHFYQQWIDEHPLMFEKLQEKIKYFNPAFHSMTPEGFNARLTFLQQCTRQGNTKTMSDKNGKTANNLAFGRPPYCVLRLGDFYNQMIVIDNISFNYNVEDGIQWDLNTEGNGVQPMLCKVSISFKFIGGGDITGPVQRLQNAMSFNYYANTSFYDNRADRAQYQPTNWATMGGAGNNKVDLHKSYAYTAKLYDEIEPTVITPTQ